MPQTTVGSCTDDLGQNCSRLSAVLNVCSDPHHAKDVCRKYCGLCDMGEFALLIAANNITYEQTRGKHVLRGCISYHFLRYDVTVKRCDFQLMSSYNTDVYDGSTSIELNIHLTCINNSVKLKFKKTCILSGLVLYTFNQFKMNDSWKIRDLLHCFSLTFNGGTKSSQRKIWNVILCTIGSSNHIVLLLDKNISSVSRGLLESMSIFSLRLSVLQTSFKLKPARDHL